MCAHKFFIKINNCGVQSQLIFFTKEYFFFDFFTVITIWKQTTKMFCWFWTSIKGLEWLIPEWLCQKAKNTYVVLLRFLELAKRFCEALSQSRAYGGLFSNDFDNNSKVDDKSIFFVLKVNRGPRVAYSRMILLKGKEHVCSSSAISRTCRKIFVKFFLLCETSFLVWSRFADPKSPSLKEVTIIYRWNLNLELPRFSCLIQRIQFLYFSNLFHSLRKFSNKIIFIF